MVFSEESMENTNGCKRFIAIASPVCLGLNSANISDQISFNFLYGLFSDFNKCLKKSSIE